MIYVWPLFILMRRDDGAEGGEDFIDQSCEHQHDHGETYLDRAYMLVSLSPGLIIRFSLSFM